MNKIQRYFDSVALNYSTRSGRNLWKWMRNKEVGAVMGMLDTEHLGEVLELGSGSGYYSNLLYNQKCQRLVCVDFSSKMLENLNIPSCEKVVADIQVYQNKNRFDTIVCLGALEFLSNPDRVFVNISKMLKPHGLFVAFIPRVSFLGRIYQVFHRMHGINIRLFKLVEIENWASEAGLMMTDCRRVPLFSLAVRFMQKSSEKNLK